MGYEITRFIGEIDDEFQCSICTMVLENPINTPCEHSYCRECIKSWLSVNQTCPADRRPLTVFGLTKQSRSFRNLLNKLEIKCDFESDGCPAIIKLENLQHHVSSCEYSVFSSDKETTKRNCSLFLENRVKAQEKDISYLIQELNNQKLHFERVVNGELSSQKQYFEHMMNALQEQIRKLKDDSKREITKLSQQLCNQRDGLHNRKLIDSSEATLSHQRQEITDLSNKSNLSVNTVKWQVINNMIDKENILSTAKKLYGCNGTLGYVQSRYYLEPTKSYCKIRMLNSSCKSSWIGLTCKVEGQFSFSLRISFIYASDGEVIVHNKHVLNGSAWKQGDVIECGITFPKNFIDNGKDKVLVYFTKNEEIIFKKPFKIRCCELFPTIQTFNDTRIKYINS